MDIQTATKEAFSRWLDFQGRSSRPAFWWFALAYIIGYIVALILDALLGIPVVSIIYALALLIPNLAVSIRRLHDIDRSGWWLLISLIPVVGFIVIIYFYVQPGTDGDNRFGAKPAA